MRGALSVVDEVEARMRHLNCERVYYAPYHTIRRIRFQCTHGIIMTLRTYETRIWRGIWLIVQELLMECARGLICNGSEQSGVRY
nr:hypothetical protein CFP56_72049 [Quercus suber]